MKKYNKIEELQNERKLLKTDLANLFYIYDEKKLGNNFKTFNLNRTLNILGINNISNLYYDSYVINLNDTWPLISYKFYETPKLWWIICKANNINDPSESPKKDSILKILKTDLVKNILQQITEE